jgi:hypothetical protein
MTERVDIKVTDQIDSTIPKKLRDIAAHARDGHLQVNQLTKAVKALQSQQVNQLAKAAHDLEVNLLKQMRAQKQLEATTTQAAIADTRLAIEKNRLAASTAQAEAAQERQNIANIRGQIAANNLAASEARLAGRKKQVEAATEAASNAQRISNTLSVQASGNMRQQSYIAQNLLFQLNDIAVSLASGQKPMTVFLQQGSQIATMFGPGTGAGGALRQLTMMLGGLAVKFAGPIAALGIFAGGFAVLQSKIKDATGVSVGFFDTVLATAQAFSQRVSSAISRAFEPLKPIFTGVFNFFVEQSQNAIRGAAILWNFLPGVITNALNIMANGFSIAYNFVIDFMENATNLAIEGINLLIDGMNAIPGLVGQKIIEPIERISFDAAKRGLLETKDVTDLWGESIAKADQGIQGLFEQISKLAVANSLAEDDNKFDKAAELKKVNDQLDAQIRSMYKLADARRVQEQLDQIALNFAENKKPLDAQELATLRQKLTTIQAYVRVQKETDRIVEEATGAQKNYQAALQGANRLLRDGVIGQLEYQRQVNKAGVALQAATDPLYSYNEAVKQQTQLVGFYGDELARQITVQQAVAQAAREGFTVSREQQANMLTQQKQLQDSARLQNALTSAYQNTIGVERDYTDSLSALFLLYWDGALSAARYTEEVNRLTYAHTRALDPMIEYNEQQANQLALVKTVGVETSILSEQQARYNMLLQQGKISGDFNTFALSAMGQQIRLNVIEMDMFAKSQQTVNAALTDASAQTFYADNWRNMYTLIDQWRGDDITRHKQAEQAKAAISNALMQERMTGARKFFDAFTGLQQSGNKKIAAIGKAAAISQAIIDGILATQKALSAFPPPYNYIAAAGVAATAAVNVANIKAQNVGAFKDGGSFMVGGNAGIDTNTIAMSVTKGERVTVETAAQQRANDRGTTTQTAAPQINVPVKVVNVIDPQEVLAAMQTPEGEAVVLNIIRRNPEAVKQAAKG